MRNLVTEDSNPIDIQTLNLKNACPVLSVQEVTQRAVILKLNGRNDVGRLDRRLPIQYFTFKKKILFHTQEEKRRIIRVKKSEIRKRNKAGFLLKEIPKHLNEEFLINNPTVFYISCSFHCFRANSRVNLEGE